MIDTTELIVREITSSDGSQTHQVLVDEDSTVGLPEAIRILRAALAELESR